MLKKIIILTIFIPAFLYSKDWGLNPKYDDELWTMVDIDFKISKKFELNLENEYRFQKRLDEFQQNILTFGATYKPYKFIDFNASYQVRMSREAYENNFFAQTTSSIEFLYFSLSNRLRYHHKLKEEGETRMYIRDKIKLKLELIKKAQPYFAVEGFYRFNYDDASRIEKARYQLGIDFDMAKKQEIGIFYTYEHEYDVKKPLRANILGLTYKVSFD